MLLRRITTPATHLLILRAGRRRPELRFDHSSRQIEVAGDPVQLIRYDEAVMLLDFSGDRFARRSSGFGLDRHRGVYPPLPTETIAGRLWSAASRSTHARVWLRTTDDRHLAFRGDPWIAIQLVDGMHRRGLSDASRLAGC